MTSLRLVLGDQLTRGIVALCDIAPGDVVLMAEVADETTYVKHHKQKIAFLFAAMRHFAEALRTEGIAVDYVALDEVGNTGSFRGEVLRAVTRHRATRVVVTLPGEWRVLADMKTWQQHLGIPVEIREDDRFFASRARFAAWAKQRKELRMEFFYREMRRETDLLMEGDTPAGGRWNFDAENRKRLPKSLQLPLRESHPPDTITADSRVSVRTDE